MRITMFFTVALVMLVCIQSNAQQTLPKEKQEKKQPAKKTGATRGLSISAGVGVANYFGDLIENNRFYTQPSFAFSVGAAYSFTSHLSARFDAGIQKVKAADKKNSGVQYKARNLSFESNVIDVSLAGEYSILKLEKFGFTPYITAGVGMMFFNPYAHDVAGKKQFLRELGTEGQGLTAYPDRKIYSKSAVEFPLGFGLRVATSQKITLQLEFNYRFTGTDYLDDVSQKGYPNKALLDARNTTTAKFTYRGNEVGGEPYPTSPGLNRGNPGDKDGYYTTQFRVSYHLKKKVKETTVALPVIPAEKARDRDGDGIADNLDKCPDVKGSMDNSGCPFPYVEGAELIAASPDSMTYRVYFDFDRSMILPDGFKALKRIVEILKADNSLHINITGHADNLGTEPVNMKISEERAKVTREYFLSYYINPERISTSHYGASRPADPVQQWMNRRVEITIIKK